MAGEEIQDQIPAQDVFHRGEDASSQCRCGGAAEEEERAAKKVRLLEFLSSTEPVWKDEDHPDIVALGTAEWVRVQRQTKSERQKKLEEWYERVLLP